MVEEYLVLFNFQSYSFRGEKVLHDLGVQVDFIPTPRKYGELCATSLRVKGIEREKLEEVLQENGVAYAGIHPYTPSKLLRDFTLQEEELSPLMREIAKKIREDIPLKKDDIRYLFDIAEQKEIKKLFQLAGQVRDNTMGREVELWGGIRLQDVSQDQQLISLAKNLERQGVTFLLLELGDLEGISGELILDLVKGIQSATSLKLVISGNSNLFLHYGILQKAGVPYLLKHVTLEERERFLANPQEILEEIIFLWHEGKSSLFGFSPLLPMPYQVENSFSLLGRKVTALLRILFKDALLPSFNCVSSLDLEEQLAHLEVGANQLLLDFTLEAKAGTGEIPKLDSVVEILERRGHQAKKC